MILVSITHHWNSAFIIIAGKIHMCTRLIFCFSFAALLKHSVKKGQQKKIQKRRIDGEKKGVWALQLCVLWMQSCALGPGYKSAFTSSHCSF